MASKKIEKGSAYYFQEKYSRSLTLAGGKVERAVLGHEVGLNGYTTVEQAQELYDYLELSEGDRLLDVGSGRGWPGLHIVEKSGCGLVVTDVPLAALRHARNNELSRHLSQEVGIIAADGRNLPFRSGSFSGVVHADVIC